MAVEEGWNIVSASYLAEKIRSNPDKVLVIDSRSFLEYNTCHVLNAVNVCCSKLVKRRLQQGKVSVRDLLSQTCQIDTEQEQEIIVYDQCSAQTRNLTQDCFLVVLLHKLVATFSSVSILRGGFLEFQSCHASLCESKSATSTASGGYKCPPLTSMSQPAMPVSNIGPTKILPFLYLGSQQDALSKETTEKTGISYILNVSTTSPRPPHIPEGHFLRLAVNDNYSDKLLPLFPQAFQFLDKVKEANGCVLIHCLAGISRSATVAIAYLMYTMNITSDEAYKYVKDKRPTISPNFNFLGQLLEFEKQRKAEEANTAQHTPTPDMLSEESGFHTEIQSKKKCTQDLSTPNIPALGNVATAGPLRKRPFKPFVFKSAFTTNPLAVQSPTTALSKLSFGTVSPVVEEPITPTPDRADSLPFPRIPTTSLDSLSFTPCYAGGSDGPLARRRESSPAGVHGFNNNKPVLNVNVSSHSAKSPTAGSKRPISFTTSSPELKSEATNTQGSGAAAAAAAGESQACSGDGHCSAGSGCGESGGSEDVKLRSPEIRAKRPLVRPNSIAFSSYPLFDLPSTSATTASAVGGQTVSVESSQLLSSSPSQDMDFSISSVHTEATPSVHFASTTLAISQPPPPCVVEMRSKSKHTRPTGFDQARKSRSLENLLNTPDSENPTSQITSGSGLAHIDYTQTILNASELYGQPVALDIVKRQRSRVPIRHAETHQSSSSISSSGSHNSLHGSLEIIQVS